MSAEILTTLLSGATLLVALAAGFGWMIQRIDGVERRSIARDASLERRMDARFEHFEQRTDARDASLEQRMDARFERLEQRMDARFELVEQRLGGVERELVEVKISIARLEGPPPRLQTAR